MRSVLLSILLSLGVSNAESLGELTYTMSGEGVTISDCDPTATGDLVIPDKIEALPVIKIADEAFRDCILIRTIRVPDTVNEIGYGAFRGCSLLTHINIPRKLSIISEAAFRSCVSLKSITIPKGITTIGKWAFHSCKSLTAVIIPDTVDAVPNECFASCSNLKSIDLGQAKSIGYAAFWGAGLTSVVIPDTVITLGEKSFYQCRRLDSVILSKNTSVLPDDVFRSCSMLTRIDIPASISKIGWYAFQDCESLVTISVAEENKAYSSHDGVLLNGDGSLLIFCPLARKRSYIIPEGVKVVGIAAFRNCNVLESVTIGPNVVIVQEDAFAECHKLVTVTIPRSVRVLERSAFWNCRELEDAIFLGDAPVEEMIFSKPTVVSVSETATGWGNTFSDRPVVRIPRSTFAVLAEAYAEIYAEKAVPYLNSTLDFHRDGEGLLVLTWSTFAGTTYHVESSHDLERWERIAGVQGDGEPAVVKVLFSDSQEFFRLVSH